MTAWLAFLLGGMGTYLMRLSFIFFMGDRRMPAAVERALAYVGPAAFSAIMLPAMAQESQARSQALSQHTPSALGQKPLLHSSGPPQALPLAFCGTHAPASQ